jgi:hypothetical protein
MHTLYWVGRITFINFGIRISLFQCLWNCITA